MIEEDRRRFHRIHFDAPALLTLENGQIESLIIDCCLKGALVKRQPDWQPVLGARVDLEVRLSADHLETIRMETEVNRVGRDSVSLLCNHIDLDSIIRLRRLVELNLGDTRLLERDLEHLIDT
jgi:hypothetical protein